MTKHRTITLEVRLPASVATAAKRIDRKDGNFFYRVILLAVTRRLVYDGIKDRAGT